MPLELGKYRPWAEKVKKYRPWVENGFWLLVLAVVYIVMQKVMHPGWTLFGY